MSVVLFGIAGALNFIVILFKIRKARLLDAAIDFGLLIFITMIFQGSFNSFVIGIIMSNFISIYLWFFPITLQSLFNTKPKRKPVIKNYKF